MDFHEDDVMHLISDPPEHDKGFKVKLLHEPDPVYARSYIEHCMHQDGYNLVEAVTDFINRHEIQDPTQKVLKAHLDAALFRDFKSNALSINDNEGDDDDFDDGDFF